MTLDTLETIVLGVSSILVLENVGLYAAIRYYGSRYSSNSEEQAEAEFRRKFLHQYEQAPCYGKALLFGMKVAVKQIEDKDRK